MSAVLITSVSGGTCVTRNGRVVNNQNRSAVPAQQWIPEQGPTAQSFAFRNVETGDYLHANGGAASAAIGTGSKQFWHLTPGVAPGSCYLQCEDYGNAFLASKSGSHHNGNVVYVWPKQEVWTHALTWYLHDVKVTSYMPVGQAGPTAEGLKAQEDALHIKEAESTKRDALVTAREAALEKAESALAAKQVEVQNYEAKLVEMEKDISRRQAELDNKVTGDTIDAAAKASELSAREAALEPQEAEASKQATALDGNTTSTEADLTAENARLKAEVEQLRNHHPFTLSPRTERGGRTNVPPSFRLKGTFDPVLLKKFEEGRKGMRSSMKPLAT